MSEQIAVIFDMDGVITDNNAYHEKAWRTFCSHYDVRLSDEEMHRYIFGRIARDTLEYIFQRDLNSREVDDFVEEKELIYRDLYRPVIRPLSGLIPFLDDLSGHGVVMALATSAPPGNVDFTFSCVPVKKYFSVVLNASDIERGKPDPEVYLKTMRQLGIPGKNCLVFEDSLSGIRSATDAGARLVGVATTHPPQILAKHVHTVIRDFTEMDYREVLKIMKR